MVRVLLLLLLQARVMDLERMAIKPFACHRSKVRALATVAPSECKCTAREACVSSLLGPHLAADSPTALLWVSFSSQPPCTYAWIGT